MLALAAALLFSADGSRQRATQATNDNTAVIIFVSLLTAVAIGAVILCIKFCCCAPKRTTADGSPDTVALSTLHSDRSTDLLPDVDEPAVPLAEGDPNSPPGHTEQIPSPLEQPL
jgi:hypothetical protein